MIVKMLKYQFILHSVECEEFIGRLRELGMVDITTSGWEASDGDRSLMLDIEAHTKAQRALEEFVKDGSFDTKAISYESGDEAYAKYQEIAAALADIESKIVELQRCEKEAEPWGKFSGEALRKLESEGLKISYFMSSESAYEKFDTADLTIVPISSFEGRVYFVVVTREGESTDFNLDAQMLKPLQYSASEACQEIEKLEGERLALSGDLSRVACSISLIEGKRADLLAQLQLRRVSGAAESAAEGSLLVMEAWAEESKYKDVDALLESQEGLFYIKSKPMPEDNTPVKLSNNRYARLFELVGNLYSLPKYGTIDLTPFFAPFYMLFFAICLCDAGYGAMIFAAGLGLYFKGGESMRQPAWLTIMCGFTAVCFGLLTGSAFGVPLFKTPVIDFQKDFFYASMAIGMVQILLGMVIKIAVTARAFGFKYSLGSLGWFIIILASVVSGVLSVLEIKGFEFSSTQFYVVAGVGFAIMMLFNTPGKNIFSNLISGLLLIYDGVTGLLGDVLSYVRLFAIGLSGGVLALVFNDLALGMTGLDVSWEGQGIATLVVKILGATVILLLGHGINMFMSTISSFVHPMRLTFVEFYKNAGFVMSSRKFEPITKN